jgi:hypothetical protein
MKNVLLLSILSVMILHMGCVTTSPSRKEHFPSEFYAQQLLTIGSPTGKYTILVQLERTGSLTRILFLDPQSQQPVLSMRGIGKSLEEVHWFQDPGAEMKRQVDPIFPEIVFLFEQPFLLGEEFQGRFGSDVRYRIGTLKVDDSCYFPGKIELLYPNSRVILVETLEVDCGRGKRQ